MSLAEPQHAEQAPSLLTQAEEAPEFLGVGRVLRPWGLRGEVRIAVITDFSSHFLAGKVFYIQGRRYGCQKARPVKGGAILKLEGVDTAEQAEALRELLLEVPLKDAPPLPEGRYYYFQVLGMKVYTTAGEYLGSVRHILETGSNDVYVVQGPGHETLIPAIRDVVKRVDVATQRMTIEPVKGLF